MSRIITPKFPKFLHGGDYNPDQWLDRPDILKKDIELMKKSHCNCMSVGIFSWAKLEPQEGVYELDWLEEIINNLYNNGIYTILATPSGGKPSWMTTKYPEICIVNNQGVRELHRARHNFCPNSPVFREKVRLINEKLAERFAHHPGVIMWHLSNEYGNNKSLCYCEHCQEKFREWLKNKYETLDNLNYTWWNSFWSHTYFDWSEICPPLSNGEFTNLGLTLDWKRFLSDTIVDFIDFEAKSVKKYNPDIPTTANLMEFFDKYNYFDLQKVIDVVSWDNYPAWHTSTAPIDYVAARSAAAHDLMRSLKPHQPFMLMESSPSSVSWRDADILKRPGMHLLSSMQAIAHGSDTVQYFQWRKSRGGWEKFHGAVVDHYGEADTRVFRDVTDVGTTLEKIQEIYASSVKSEVAIMFDWENRWALDRTQGPRNGGESAKAKETNELHYLDTILEHHKAFWRLGINTDLIDMTCDISKYKIVVAPMLYMFRPGYTDRVREFVKNGGTFILTYFSGVVNESDLCFLGGMPGEITDVMGIRVEEIDALQDGRFNTVKKGNKIWTATELCELSHLCGAEALAVYDSDFYKGMPVLTVNNYGNGKAYYIAAKMEQGFLDEFYEELVDKCDVSRAMNVKFPFAMTANKRIGENKDFIFLQNYNNQIGEVELDREYYDIIEEKTVSGKITMKPFDIRIFSVDKDSF